MLIELLELKFGSLPEEVKTSIRKTTDMTLLKRWGGIVLHASSLEQFLREAGL
jgi:hypothetical protein